MSGKKVRNNLICLSLKKKQKTKNYVGRFTTLNSFVNQIKNSLFDPLLDFNFFGCERPNVLHFEILLSLLFSML